MRVLISGPTGAGKSTLAHALQAAGWKVQHEIVDPNLLCAFDREPRVNCFNLQNSIMRARQASWPQQDTAEYLAMDRSIGEDFEVFCKLHEKLGFLDKAQMSALEEEYRLLAKAIPAPDLTVYVCAQAEVLKRRLKANGAPKVIIDSLEQQLYLYELWASKSSGSLLRLDTSHSNASTVISLFQGVFHGPK